MIAVDSLETDSFTKMTKQMAFTNSQTKPKVSLQLEPIEESR